MPELNYFPLSSLDDSDEKSFGETLQGLEELPLFPVSTEHEPSSEFRFLVSPSFRPSSLIRVRAIGITWWIVHKWEEGTGQKVLVDYQIGDKVVQASREYTVLHRAERMLSGSEAKNLEALIKSLNFFSLPTKNEVSGCDGETWLLEGIIKGRYHVVHRWFPSSATLVNFGNYLLNLSQNTWNSSSPPPQDSIFDAFQESLQNEEIQQAFEFHRILQCSGFDRKNSTLKDIVNILRTPEHFDEVLQLVQDAQEDSSDLAQLAIVVAERCEENQALALVNSLGSLSSRTSNAYAL